MEAKVRAMDASDSDGSGGRPERKKKSESDGAGLDSPSHMQTDNGGEERRDTEKKKRAEWYSDDIRFALPSPARFLLIGATATKSSSFAFFLH